MSFSAPALRVEPASSSISGFKSYDYNVTLTNLSLKPIWYEFAVPERPLYDVYTRANSNDPWKLDPVYLMCGLGVDKHPIAAGGTVTFRFSVAAEQSGRKYCLQLGIWTSADEKAKPAMLSSPELTVP